MSEGRCGRARYGKDFTASTVLISDKLGAVCIVDSDDIALNILAVIVACAVVSKSNYCSVCVIVIEYFIKGSSAGIGYTVTDDFRAVKTIGTSSLLRLPW